MCGRSPQELCCSRSSFFKAATVVWLRRGEARTRSGAHDAGFGRVLVGSRAPAPHLALWEEGRGPGAREPRAALTQAAFTVFVRVHFAQVTSLQNLVEVPAFGERRAFWLGREGEGKKQKKKKKKEKQKRC